MLNSPKYRLVKNIGQPPIAEWFTAKQTLNKLKNNIILLIIYILKRIAIMCT